MKTLAIGDVVAESGQRALARYLPRLQEQHEIDFTVVNIENAANGNGLTQAVYDDFLQLDIDVMTSGNHIFDKREIFDFIDQEPRLLRPLNFPKNTAGAGMAVVNSVKGTRVAVLNVMGQAFMHPILDCPMVAVEAALAELDDDVKTIFIDFHAETSSEKATMGWAFDGRVSGIWGTHTHIPTADARLLHEGTAFITDLGMCGDYDSVIGSNKEMILRRMRTKLPTRFEPATGKATVCGVVIETDDKTGRARSIEQIQLK